MDGFNPMLAGVEVGELRRLSIPSPFGLVRVYGGRSTLHRVVLPGGGDFWDDTVAEWRGESGYDLLTAAGDFLEGYFFGGKSNWEGRIPEGPPFYRAAWAAAARIPFGRTLTYGELAVRAGRPKAYRAAGGAMANNPLPLLIPCHRVIGAHGAIGGFGGREGTDLKRRLLEFEGVWRR